MSAGRNPKVMITVKLQPQMPLAPLQSGLELDLAPTGPGFMSVFLAQLSGDDPSQTIPDGQDASPDTDAGDDFPFYFPGPDSIELSPIPVVLPLTEVAVMAANAPQADVFLHQSTVIVMPAEATLLGLDAELGLDTEIAHPTSEPQIPDSADEAPISAISSDLQSDCEDALEYPLAVTPPETLGMAESIRPPVLQPVELSESVPKPSNPAPEGGKNNSILGVAQTEEKQPFALPQPGPTAAIRKAEPVGVPQGSPAAAEPPGPQKSPDQAIRSLPEQQTLPTMVSVSTIGVPPVLTGVQGKSRPIASDVNVLMPDDHSLPMHHISPAISHSAVQMQPPNPTPIPGFAALVTQSENGMVEVVLDPEELGRLRLSMQPDGETIRVHLIAERGETLDLMRRHATQLMRELVEAGYEDASLSFGSWQGHGSDQTPHQSAKRRNRGFFNAVFAQSLHTDNNHRTSTHHGP